MFSIFSSAIGFEKFDYDAPCYGFLHALCMSFFKLLLYMQVYSFHQAKKGFIHCFLTFSPHSYLSGDPKLIHAKEWCCQNDEWKTPATVLQQKPTVRQRSMNKNSSGRARELTWAPRRQWNRNLGITAQKGKEATASRCSHRPSSGLKLVSAERELLSSEECPLPGKAEKRAWPASPASWGHFLGDPLWTHPTQRPSEAEMNSR